MEGGPGFPGGHDLADVARSVHSDAPSCHDGEQHQATRAGLSSPSGGTNAEHFPLRQPGALFEDRTADLLHGIHSYIGDQVPQVSAKVVISKHPHGEL